MTFFLLHFLEIVCISLYFFLPFHSFDVIIMSGDKTWCESLWTVFTSVEPAIALEFEGHQLVVNSRTL